MEPILIFHSFNTLFHNTGIHVSLQKCSVSNQRLSLFDKVETEQICVYIYIYISFVYIYIYIFMWI